MRKNIPTSRLTPVFIPGTALDDFVTVGKQKHTTHIERPKELLTHVIKLAKSAGFSFRNFLDEYDSFVITSFNTETGRLVFVLRNEQELRVVYDSIYTLFFDLNFARAIFGDHWERKLVALAETPDKLGYVAKNILIPFTHDTNENEHQIQSA